MDMIACMKRVLIEYDLGLQRIPRVIDPKECLSLTITIC